MPWLGRFLTWFDGRIEALQHRYERVIRWALGHRKTVLFGAIGLFVASMFLFPLIGSEFVPKEDQSDSACGWRHRSDQVLTTPR